MNGRFRRPEYRWVAGCLLLVAQAFCQGTSAAIPVGPLNLVDMDGRNVVVRSSHEKITVVMLFSTRCPMSNAFNYRRERLYAELNTRVRFIAIDPNANESLPEIRTYAEEAGFSFPVYRDGEQQAADSLGAMATTENFVLDKAGLIRYRGFIEDAANPERTTRRSLKMAIDAMLAGQPVVTPVTHGPGCAIRRVHPLTVARE